MVRRVDFVNGDAMGIVRRRRCAEQSGFSFHANMAVAGADRQRLERPCRWVARPPLCAERLSVLADGRLVHGLRRPWSDGTREVVFDPLDFVANVS